MQFKKILDATRIDSNSDGTERTIKLSPSSGGRMVKNVQYMLKVNVSSGANVRLTVELWHGPDGLLSILHSTPINAGDPTASGLLVGDADSTKVIGEFLLVVVKIKDTAVTTAQWAAVELFEMRKPF